MATNKRDLKAFVRLDYQNRSVPSSLILRKSKPKIGKWVEVDNVWRCCNTTTTTTIPPTTTTTTTVAPTTTTTTTDNR